MTDATLVSALECSDNKRHTLFTWITRKLEEVNDGEFLEEECDFKALFQIQEDLDSFVRFIAVSEEKDDLDSHQIFISFSHVYCSCLLRLMNERPGRIYDSAELLAKVLSEEDVSVEEADKSDKKSKKKKASTKRTYTFSPAKDLACTVLIQMFETFEHQLSSLAPLLFSISFKNLKKMLDKSKYLHASFITSLMQLVNSILRHSGASGFYTEYFSKFAKYSKRIFEEICSDGQEFPTDMVSAVLEIWSNYFQQDSFIKEHKTDLEHAILLKYTEGELSIIGFANDETRLHIARSLAEVLFHYYFVINTLGTEQIWSLYSQLLTFSAKKDVQVGCVESIIHFSGLCAATDAGFLEASNYLKITNTLADAIFSPVRVKSQTVDTLSRYLRYFKHLHKNLLPRMSESNKNVILLRILYSDDDENNQRIDDKRMRTVNTDPQQLWFNLAQLDLAQLLIVDLSSSFGDDQHIVAQIKAKLVELSTCDIFSIRIQASEVLRAFLSNFPELLTETIEFCLNELTKCFELTEGFPFASNHGHSLVIAKSMSLANRKYVPFELIMRITVFATSFIKNHTTTTSDPQYHKSLLCWILLMGSVNYKDEQHLQMQSSQLFLFWKVLLTHTYSYRDDEDLYRNLEIRNHALVCLLTFVGNASINNNVARQISYLLVKCSNFNHSIGQKSPKIDKMLLTNELRLLQIYLRLEKLIKSDFSCSLLILIMKNFSDPHLYFETNHSVLDSIKNIGETKRLSKLEQPEDQVLETSVASVLHQEDGFAYGISSKISLSSISRLYVNSVLRRNTSLNASWGSKGLPWYHTLEAEIKKPISPSCSADYFIELYSPDGYSESNQYSPKITTALIDASMEIFSVIFPYLNGKIQYSVLESLNVSMFSKTINPLRNVAIAANVLVSISTALEIIHEKELPLDPAVAQLLLKSIEKIEFFSDYFIMKLKADCTGLVCAALSRSSSEQSAHEVIADHVNILIKSVVDVEEPFMRVLRALSLASIYKYNPMSAPFSRIFSVILTLVKDPHPVVHFWSLKAMLILLERDTTLDTNLVANLLSTLAVTLSEPSYGMYGSSVLRHNYSIEFNSHVVIGEIAKNLALMIGPSFPELSQEAIDSFRNMTYSFVVSQNIALQCLGLEIYDNLSAFKLKNVLKDHLFLKLVKSTFDGSIIVGFGSNYFSCYLTQKNEIFSINSSPGAASRCFELLELLVKLQKEQSFLNIFESAAWEYLDLSSSDSVENFLYAWMDQTYDQDLRWFDKLYLMFNMSKLKLYKSYYKDVEIVLDRKGTRREINDSTEKQQRQEHQQELQRKAHSSSDPISWRAQLFILQLIKKLCSNAKNSSDLSAGLSQKIPELIRLSFQACTSRLAPLKALGLDLLKAVIELYADVEDPENPGHSILEQQEAQIISALMPAVSPGSPPDVVISALNVSADIISSEISPLPRMSRISELLVQCLGIFNDKSSIVNLMDVLIITQKTRRRMELAILGAWADLVQRSLSKSNVELENFTKEYWDVLVPLWILTLREYVMIKYEGRETQLSGEGTINESQSSKLEPYENVWLNMIIALSCILEEDSEVILSCLNKSEIESFMFILFTQCIEVLNKDTDEGGLKVKVIKTLHNVLKCGVPLETLFEDGTIEEIVNIIDRLMIMSDNEEKLQLIKVIDQLIKGYMRKNSTHEKFLIEIDKVYEFLRLLLMPITEKLPYVKYGFSGEDSEEELSLDKSDTLLLQESFNVLESNVKQFDDVFKVDLYSCLLFIIVQVFRSEGRDSVISTVFPLLKTICCDRSTKNAPLLTVFYTSIEEIILKKLEIKNQLATYFIILSSGFNGCSQEFLDTSVEKLILGLRNDDTRLISNHGLKSLINNCLEYPSCRYVIKRTVSRISECIVDEDVDTARLMLDIVKAFTAKCLVSQSPLSQIALTLGLTIVLTYCDKRSDDHIAVEVLIALIKLDREAFRNAVKTSMNEQQKACIGSIIENSPLFAANRDASDYVGLELRSFR